MGRSAPQLPFEIWQQIASHLTLREWAQGCGACKTMSQLQLQNVRLSECMPEDEMKYPAAGTNENSHYEFARCY